MASYGSKELPKFIKSVETLGSFPSISAIRTNKVDKPLHNTQDPKNQEKRTNLSQQKPSPPSSRRHRDRTGPRRSYPSPFPLRRSANRTSQKALHYDCRIVEGTMIGWEIQNSSNPRKWGEKGGVSARWMENSEELKRERKEKYVRIEGGWWRSEEGKMAAGGRRHDYTLFRVYFLFSTLLSSLSFVCLIDESHLTREEFCFLRTNTRDRELELRIESTGALQKIFARKCAFPGA